MNSSQPFEECPRYPGCSVNFCPLDPDSQQHRSDPGDKERKCTMRQSVRVRIGSKYPALLPFKGLTKREFNGIERWRNKTPEAKAAVLARLDGFTYQKREQKAKTHLESAL